MTSQPLTSQSYQVGSLDEAIEFYYEKGWTDGLPVVPPTEEKVLAFLEYAGKRPNDVIGIVQERGRVVTAEKVAINAIMAGCKPEYAPVVIAVAECIVHDDFCPHGSTASTGSSAPLIVVNGPVRERLGFVSQGNVFGPNPEGRANATIGRAIRLVILNVFGSSPGVVDRSTMGHPGKYTYCIAEDEESSPWEPLHAERGYQPEESTVTVFTAMAPWQVENRRARTAESTLLPIVDVMKGVGARQGELLVVINGEFRGPLREAGWSKAQVREFLWERAQRTAKDWAACYRAEDPRPGTGDSLVPVVLKPQGIFVLAAGGHAGTWSAVVPMWASGRNSRGITRPIDTSRIM